MEKYLALLLEFLKSDKSKLFAGAVLALVAEFVLGNLPKDLLYQQVLQLVLAWLGVGAAHGLGKRAAKYFLK